MNANSEKSFHEVLHTSHDFNLNNLLAKKTKLNNIRLFWKLDIFHVYGINEIVIILT